MTTLVNFNDTNGADSFASLIQATDGNFYGTTADGGANGLDAGTIFKMTPGGMLTTQYNFGGPDGEQPMGPLVQAADGNFYGTTSHGGAHCIGKGCGTVFKITPGGELTTLYSFNKGDGSQPFGGLVQATDGNFYGTTSGGGANNGGTVFQITSTGTLTTLYDFCAQDNCTDGYGPHAGLVQAADGSLYGTSTGGGANGSGTVFNITLGGTLTTLYGFCAQANCSDGEVPLAPLLQGTDGNLYGTASRGGNINNCNGVGCGTVFQITAGGTLTTLYTFCSQADCADGSYPVAALVQGTDGNFYGTAEMGGSSSNCTGGCGTIFKITSAGSLTNLYSFCTQSNCPDGSSPAAGLIQATDGNF